jgi:ribulose-phosphate 3-epimerase
LGPEKTFPSFLIAPSILSADFAKLGEEIRAVEMAGADWIHVDVMDGHFVPNLTIGAPVVKSLRKTTKLPLDVHLMIDHPDRYAEDFIKAGADYLTLHVESEGFSRGLLEEIKAKGVKPGITLRPGTPLKDIEEFLPVVDLVLVMTVEPGFGGQSFMHDQVSKIHQLKALRASNAYSYLIEVDGGISDQTAPQVVDAEVLVAGSYVFKNDYKKAITTLKEIRRSSP